MPLNLHFRGDDELRWPSLAALQLDGWSYIIASSFKTEISNFLEIELTDIFKYQIIAGRIRHTNQASCSKHYKKSKKLQAHRPSLNQAYQQIYQRVRHSSNSQILIHLAVAAVHKPTVGKPKIRAKIKYDRKRFGIEIKHWRFECSRR